MGDNLRKIDCKNIHKQMSILINKINYYSRLSLVTLLLVCKKLLTKFNSASIEFKKRFFTSIIFSVVFIFIVSAGHIIYSICISLLCISMIYEIVKMCRNIKNESEMILIRRISILYIIFCCLSIVLVRNLNQGFKITLWMFFVVWSVDTFAYIFGKKYGKTKLIPAISPGKTYEGALFGTIAGIVISMLMYHIFYMNSHDSLSNISFFILSVIIVILSQIGDLTESYVKRKCGVKDSGKFLPGHGGACDRFDSLLFVAPFVFIIALLNGGALF